MQATGAGPLSILSLIVAPAILTNASTVLSMSTSNRLARAVDRARELAKQLEQAAGDVSSDARRRMSELERTELRSLMLTAALRNFYIALGCFGSATILALAGAVIALVFESGVGGWLELAALLFGIAGLGAIVHGSVLLVRETRIVVAVLQERVASVRKSAQSRGV